MFETDLKNYKAGPRAKAFTNEQSWLLQNLKRMLNDNALKEHNVPRFKIEKLLL